MARQSSKREPKAKVRRTKRELKAVTEILVEQEEKSYREPKKISLVPQTDNQKRFITNMRKHEVSAAIGPAGVGKTYCAAGVAAQFFLDNFIDGIVLTRANVTVGTTIGFLPGTANEKMEPLLMPILDALKRHLTAGKVKYMIEKQQIEMLPFEYVRGRSFIDKVVIVDEAQNLTPEDMIAIITRYESGRIILLGDPFQNDLKGDCGLVWLARFAERNNLDMPVTCFSIEDIVRSEFVKRFITHLYAEHKVSEAFAIHKC